MRTASRAFITFLVFALICLSSLAFRPDAIGSDDGISVCFISGVKPDRVVKQWIPMLQYLTEKVGRPFNIVLADSYDDMMRSYREGGIDLLVAGPYNYVKTKGEAGAELIVGAIRPGGKALRGVVAARKDSGIRSIKDLKDRSFAFTDIFSTTGYLMPRVILAKNGIEQPTDFMSEVIFSGHHSASLDALLSGRIDAAALASYFIDDLSEKKRGLIGEIVSTRLLPPEPIFARAELDEALVEEIRSALMQMPDQVSPDVMRRLNVARFEIIDDSDYDVVREDVRILSALPPIAYSVDYGRAPSSLNAAVKGALRVGRLVTLVVPVGAILLLVALTLLFLKRIKRDLRLRFAVALFGVLSAVALVIGFLSCEQLDRELARLSVSWLKDIDVFSGQVGRVASEGEARLIQPFADGLAAQEGVLFVKLLRGGRYIADTQAKDVGHSVVPKILADAFSPGADFGGRAIIVEENIMTGGNRFALTQVGLDSAVIDDVVRKIFIANTFAIFVLFLLGLILSIYWSRRVTRPLLNLSRAISDVRMGNRTEMDVESGTDQIGDLTRAFSQMQTELKRTEDLLKLKGAEFDEVEDRLSHLVEEEERIEGHIVEIEKEIDAGAAKRLESVRSELDAVVRESRGPGFDVELLAQKIAEMEKEIPKLGELRATRILGIAPAFLPVIRDIIIRSRDQDPVLLYGESGAGKTGVAESIHLLSSRGEGRLVEYNCAELAATDPVIVLGKLFGYGRDCGISGVPSHGQHGLLKECEGTTLFLDEIGLLPPQAQAMLLLPLEGRPFNVAAGKGEPITADVRFIFASNVPLEEEVSKGRFRNDLLRRIKARGFIAIPPLRERSEDVELLARHFLGMWQEEKGASLDFGDDAVELLKGYDYHNFNVAELASIVKVAADNAQFRESEFIEIHHFSGEIADFKDRMGAIAGDTSNFDAGERSEIAALRKHEFRLSKAEQELGLSKGSRTLSNHLRGLSFKILSMMDWRVEDAVSALTGTAASKAVRGRVRRKIELYQKNVRELAGTENEQRLFNNLPQKYHAFVSEAVSRAPRRFS